MEDVNVSSLRAVAGALNTEVGYTKYGISVDSLYGIVRIANDVWTYHYKTFWALCCRL